MNLTITPSIRCNSRCLTCNLWRKEAADELTLNEFEQIFRNLGRAPFWVTISGGEPFMNRDIVNLTGLLYHYCRPSIINIPTNCLLDSIIPRRVADIAQTCRGAQIIVNLSLDGVGEKHDRLRGIRGNFQRFEQTYYALRNLRCPNLAIGIHSVISKYNLADLPELIDYAVELEPDQYIVEIAEERVELGTIGAGITPSAAEFRQAMAVLEARLAGHTFPGISRVTQAFRRRYYRLVGEVLDQRRQVVPCQAGWASAQINPNGDVWACCVRGDVMLNLREANYDLRQIWQDPRALSIRQSIRSGACSCPLANAAYTNLLLHPPALAGVAWEILASQGRR